MFKCKSSIEEAPDLAQKFSILVNRNNAFYETSHE
jgi:hypothetical protein